MNRSGIGTASTAIINKPVETWVSLYPPNPTVLHVHNAMFFKKMWRRLFGHYQRVKFQVKWTYTKGERVQYCRCAVVTIHCQWLSRVLYCTALSVTRVTGKLHIQPAGTVCPLFVCFWFSFVTFSGEQWWPLGSCIHDCFWACPF